MNSGKMLSVPADLWHLNKLRLDDGQELLMARSNFFELMAYMLYICFMIFIKGL